MGIYIISMPKGEDSNILQVSLGCPCLSALLFSEYTWVISKTHLRLQSYKRLPENKFHLPKWGLLLSGHA